MITHYQALNVSFSADLAGIKKAYHKISLLHHPDKTYHLPEAERAQREHMFKLANTAFEVLSDAHKRKSYDQNLVANQSRFNTQDRSFAAARPPRRERPRDFQSQFGRESSPPPRPSRQGHQDLHRAPLSTYRFSASTLGTPPDYHWYHCDLNEREERARFSYSNWLGWRFSIDLAHCFKVVAKPIISMNPTERSIVVRLILQRRLEPGPRPVADIVMDLMGTPGSKHAILSSALIETKESLQLHVELAVAPEATQKDALGPVSWNWAYKIDHGPLMSTLTVKVTNVMLYPFKPHMALSPTGGLPAMRYPDGSPMRGLLNLDPNIRIEKLASELYCKQEEQQGTTLWRLKALGFK